MHPVHQLGGQPHRSGANVAVHNRKHLELLFAVEVQYLDVLGLEFGDDLGVLEVFEALHGIPAAGFGR